MKNHQGQGLNHRSLILLLAFLVMPGALCIDAYLPSLPAIARAFAVSAAAAQQTLTVYLAGFAFMTLFYGTLSDSFGRRPVILASLWLYLLGSVGAALSTNLATLLFFRALQGLSAGAGSVVGRAVVGDCLSGAEAQRAMATIWIVFGVAPAVAPIAGGWIQATLGWRSVFLFIALCGLALLVGCLRALPETLPKDQRHSFHFGAVVARYWEVACHPSFLLRSLGTALLFCAMTIYVGGAPAFVMGVLHLGVTDFGWLFIPLIGGMTLGSWVAGRISHRFPPGRIIGIGFAVASAAALLNLAAALLLPGRLPWAVLPVGLYSFGMAVANPAMTVVTLELFPAVRGLAASLQGFVFMALFALVSGLVCPLLSTHAVRYAAVLLLLLVLSGLTWLLAGRLSAAAPVSDDPPLAPLPPGA